MTTLRQAEPSTYSRILSYGAARGNTLVANDDLVEKIDSSDEWIRQRTGIVTRHRADENQSITDLAVDAAKDALERASLTGDDIDTVIVSTITHPHATPSLAVLVADAIGSKSPAYDISAACAGFCYGIAQADALVKAGTARNVLVIGVEKLSDFIDDTERTISFLLGDGAGAAVVGASDTPGIAPTVWGSDGSRFETVGMTHSLLEIRNRDFIANPVQEGEKIWPTMRQDGPSVFRWAVWEMAKVAQQALDTAGITADQLGALITHQANERIIDQMVKTLKLPDTVAVARDIVNAGNTSAASVPLAAHRLLEENPELSGTFALQIGFGAGLAFAAQVVVLP
ncbi:MULTISPECIES: beta-ketoacyl-ACP synthase III [unclassified Rothia (in: high G+C Gram-positive bacteria)]|uniref:beta-ketoacyl-ACP synthase III n=1 Tax=unclassified Rothia (in: high G+C Gram-positive bacteria) TaxID=2689056 RepID=UPI0019565E7A|nr:MULTISPECIES: beta-ketoacyl-ACP synthase III [unclassified Rothia (in: high G+C Gram-positive bacteria)]MBM7050896.1 ketoacyl-ACP synthase III [Rothia sp. ZJ1223]QRZ62365.1 ketoacyl-ACP synthase III [Rothia sp. ZJ932]